MVFFFSYSEQPFFEDKKDLKRSVQRIMNKAAASRLISKQESDVLLGNLDLTLCSETIESVSISNTKRLKLENEKEKKDPILSQYEARSSDMENMCLNDFYHHIKNKEKNNDDRKFCIPHFVGINGSPVYPVSHDYAKQSLVVYRPWRTYPKSKNWREEFESFINLPSTPVSCKLPYYRVVQRWHDKMAGYEPVATDVDTSTNDLPDEAKTIMELTGFSGKEGISFNDAVLKKIDRGLNFNWNRSPKVRNNLILLIFWISNIFE